MLKRINKRIVELGFEVADRTNALLAYWDKDLICRYANNSYKEWFGTIPENMIDKMHIKEFLGPLYQKNRVYINNALKGKLQVFERDIPIASGEIIHSVATYCPDIENGEVKGFFVHVADVTFLKSRLKAEQQRNEIKYVNVPDDDPVMLVAQTLRSYILTGFPGIPQLARFHYISESRLKKDFKKVFHTTVFAYFRRLQMELAEQHIAEKRSSIKQLALMFNFSNPSNFSACYKNYLKEKTDRQAIEALKNASAEQYRLFISQTPFAIAMLDPHLRYITTSKKWCTDFDLPGDLKGESIHTHLPEVARDWKKAMDECIHGKINKGEDLLFIHKNKRAIWLKWDIRAWYTIDNTFGGVMIFTEDVTELKDKTEENEKILEILNKTNEIARIGAWKRNFITGKGIWSKITKEILEVPEDFEPSLDDAINFYKAGKSRKKIKSALNKAVNKGEPIDMYTEMVTAKGNVKKVRVICYPVFRNGKCEKILGIFQDLTAETERASAIPAELLQG